MPNFVLQWTIDNARATFETRKAESDVFNEGGFEWIAGIRENSVNSSIGEFTLKCLNPRGGVWRCVTDVELVIIKPVGCCDYKSHHIMEYSDGNNVQGLNLLHSWEILLDPHQGVITVYDKVFVEFRLHIICSEDCDPATFDLSKFCSPNEMSNVTLLIGDKKLKVSKELLAIHSPVFAAMFFGDFAEKGKEEVEIKDLVYEEFINLLRMTIPGAAFITDSSVMHILKLADRFQMEGVMADAEKYLIRSKEFKGKMGIADQYRLIRLRTDNFSDETRLAVEDRLSTM